jgi:lipopolysaccharide transport system permease protein
VASRSTVGAAEAATGPGKTPEPVDGAQSRARRWEELAQFSELVLHLARREAASRQRFTLLGWAWPLARQLAQLGILVFVFSRIVRLGIPDFPVFVFSGLIAWTWFASGLGAATSSVVANRNLVFQSRFPVSVLPAVAIVVPLLDVAFALPVIALMLALAGELHATFAFLPIVLIVQLVLMSGLAWLVAAAYVYFRDVQNIVGVLLLLLFYVTPVFYDRELVPERYEWVLLMNPMTHLIEAYRRIFLGGSLPDPSWFGILAAASLVVAFVGYVTFRRSERTFVDEL